MRKDVSIIIISFNTKGLTLDCINTVIKHTKGVNYEVIVVDNASKDGTVETLRKYKGIVLLENKENLGFGGGNNLGMKKAKGRHILLLNSDTKLHEDSVSKMVKWMDENPKIGVSTCRLINPDKTTQPTGGQTPTLLRLFAWALFIDDIPLWSTLFGSYHPHKSYYKKSRELDWVTGAFMLIRSEAIDEVGLFDSNFFMYTEDVEYSYRFKKHGWKIWFVPITSVLHIGGGSSRGEEVVFSEGSTGKERSIIGELEGIKLFYKKHFKNQYNTARLLIKVGTLLRLLTFGFLLGQFPARKIYLKAFLKT